MEELKRQTESVAQLADALAKAQMTVEPPKKDKTAKIKSTKGDFSYHYSDLASLIDAIRKPFGENGLSYTQRMEWRDNVTLLVTRLMHSSGEWIDSEVPLPLYERPQEFGSALSYLRRYALGAIVGLAPEDDDGAAAQKGTPSAPPERKPVEDKMAAAITDIAEQIAMTWGGSAGELVARASAFRPGKDVEQLTAEQRWEDEVLFRSGTKYCKALSDVPRLTDKWKGKTLAELNARLEALRLKGGDDTANPEGDPELPF